MRFRRLLCILVVTLLSCTALIAQQTGSISGKVTATDGSALPGVTVEARSNVLPQPRVTVTDTSGNYRLPALQPGSYTLTFTLAGMQTATRKAEALLSENTVADVKLGVQGLSESITVTAESTLVDKASTAISSTLSSDEMQRLPIGQDYRDLVKLAPGVMYTQADVRGPSAGGSGQDNVFQFDGVNVTLPLFGTLSAEPATHDIAQLSVVKGGAKAFDFNRSGGFTMDSVSRSGTSKFSGQIGYQVQNHGMTSKLNAGSNSKYDQDRAWGDVNIGGPILSDRLFFYGSYYRPTIARNNRANLYGSLPEYKSTRNEEFGKLTFTPTSALLFNGSYRNSNHREKSSLFGSASASTTGTGNDSKQTIGILEGSWITGAKSFATAKFTDYKLKTAGVPDGSANTSVSTAIGTQLDINNLEKLGLLNVPTPRTGSTATIIAYNTFIAPYIAKYGYVSPTTGVLTGGGAVGVGTTFDADDFFRKSGQVGYNLTMGTNITHDLHAGYQRYNDSENLTRSTNGWGSIGVIGGLTNCSSTCLPSTAVGTPIFFQAAFQQQTTGAVPTIHSEYHSQNFEVNDTIHWNNWSFNAGVMASNDTLYGQGLAKADNVAGFVKSPGTKYKMYDVPFQKMIQPRLGATWAYNSIDTLYTSFAIYNPATSSLPRAASWDRNLATTINAYFDATGKLFATDPVASSSGKLFVPDMKPRTVKEYLLGTAKQINNRWSARLYTRYRHADHFWEDTNNAARVCFKTVGGECVASSAASDAPSSVPHQLYIPDLTSRRAAIGSGSTYVIATLDGAFTKYYEATLESDWRGNKAYLKGTYTWSHYYGNFDQDNTSLTTDSDFNTFYGSSNIADGAGRQLWNNKYGDLRGDRRNLLKVYGSYYLPWRASAGAYAIYQSGQPWEAWSYEPYNPGLTTSTSDTDRLAEPAGSRKTPAHYQLDLNYTQNFPVSAYDIKLKGDVFNLFNKQTGYAYQQSVHSALFGQPALYWRPRTYQLALRVEF